MGLQPEFDVGENETLYGAIRYDDERRELSKIVCRTYSSAISISFPATSSLMEFEHESPRALSATAMREIGGCSSRARRSALRPSPIGTTSGDRDCLPQLGYLTMLGAAARQPRSPSPGRSIHKCST